MAKFITLAECKRLIREATRLQGLDVDYLKRVKDLVESGKLKDIRPLVKCLELILALLDSELFYDTHSVYTIRVSDKSHEKLQQYKQVFGIGSEGVIERALEIYLKNDCPCCGQKINK